MHEAHLNSIYKYSSNLKENQTLLHYKGHVVNAA
jgi:hypothetical protein